MSVSRRRVLLSLFCVQGVTPQSVTPYVKHRQRRLISNLLYFDYIIGDIHGLLGNEILSWNDCLIVILHYPKTMRTLNPWTNGIQNCIQLLTHFLVNGFIVIPAFIPNNIDYKMCDEITYPFPHFTCATVEVWAWMSNNHPHFTGHMFI